MPKRPDILNLGLDHFSTKPRASAAPAAAEADASNGAAPPPDENWDAAVAGMGETGSVVRNVPIQDRLPPEAAEKLDDLRIEVEQAFDAVRAESAKARELSDDYLRAQTHFDKLRHAYAAGHMQRRTIVREFKDPELADLEMHPKTSEVRETIRVEPDNKRLDDEQRKLDRLKTRRDKRIAERERLESEANQIGGLLRGCEDFLRDLPREIDVVALYDGDAPKTPKGDISAAVEKLRHQLVAIAEDVADILAAPPTSAEMKAVLKAQIEGLARRGKPDVSPLLDGLRPAKMPETQTRTSVVTSDSNTGIGHGAVVDSAALIAWLNEDRLLAAMESEIDSAAEDCVALNREEKAKRLSDLAKKRLEVERAEVALLDMAGERGIRILPRPDCDPRAYLNLADELPEPRG